MGQDPIAGPGIKSQKPLTPLDELYKIFSLLKQNSRTQVLKSARLKNPGHAITIEMIRYWTVILIISVATSILYLVSLDRIYFVRSSIVG
jgi:hypothetical protein